MQSIPVFLTALACAVVSYGACAQPFPGKAVRIIVAFPPGGGVDIVARNMGPKLTEIWNQQMDVVGSTPEQFGAFMKSETAKWAKIIREANIRAK